MTAAPGMPGLFDRRYRGYRSNRSALIFSHVQMLAGFSGKSRTLHVGTVHTVRALDDVSDVMHVHSKFR
jgi:hypothetical protein